MKYVSIFTEWKYGAKEHFNLLVKGMTRAWKLKSDK